MTTMKYGGMTIQFPIITPQEIEDICDWYGTSFHIMELDTDAGSLEYAKKLIDATHEDMERFNNDNPEDAVSDILEYIEECLIA